MQHDSHAHKFHDKLWAEFALVTAMVIILIIMAARYAW
jgi:LPS O-antigen subunit length determinant protein (WzzB/FepE family)